jgi:hypothetical protein
MIRSKSMPDMLQQLRMGYAYSPIRQSIISKKRKTSPHPYTVEFADLVLTKMYQDIVNVIMNDNNRMALLIRFPLLYGCIQPGFRCHRTEMEEFIEYIRAYAIQWYCGSVSRSFQKTKLFKQKIFHFSKVKLRNILYAMSNNHNSCLGAITIMCGHTVVWRDTMYNTCKPTREPKIQDLVGNKKNVDLVHYNIIPSNKLQVCLEMMTMTSSIKRDNELRHTFKIMDDLVY